MWTLGEDALSPQESAAWYDVIGQFREAAARFDVAYSALQFRPMREDAALSAERAALLARAETVGSTVQYIRAALDDVTAALSGAWSQVSGAWSWIAAQLGFEKPPADQSTLQGLGLPLIPIAAVLAAIAAITAFLADYAKFAQRVAVYEAAVDKGATAQEAAAAVDRALGPTSQGLLPSLSSGVQSLGYAAVGVAMLWAVVSFAGRRRG